MKVTQAMIERGSQAIYEMTRGAAIPGVVDGVEARHVGARNLAEAVLRAALNDPVEKLPVVIPGQTDIYDHLPDGRV
jgi:hypothetical protein